MSTATTSPFQALRRSAQQLPESGIMRVFNYGMNREGLIPLWAGEGDTPTPEAIHQAATKSLHDGETFYTYQLGIPNLREALAQYFEHLYARPFSSDEFFVTAGGMQAIQIAMQMTAGEGDEVIILSPGWPNFEGGGTRTGRGAEVRRTAVRRQRMGTGSRPPVRLLRTANPCNLHQFPC